MQRASNRGVIVVGGGVTGLLTAARLQASGTDVVLLEAEQSVGGQVRTVDFAGKRIDIGAEAVYVSSPAVAALLEEFDLLDHSVRAAPGRSWLATPTGLRRLPPGIGPAGPTRLLPVVTSGLLSLRGTVRAALEPLVAAFDSPLSQAQDASVGSFVTRRFGPEVTSTFVDPLLGNVHAGDVNRLSVRSCVPAAAHLATTGRSMVFRRSAKNHGTGSASPQGSSEMTFISFGDGLTTLVQRLSGAIDDVRPGSRVTHLEFDGATARALGEGPHGSFDLNAESVVLALPANAVARLLGPHVPDAVPDLTGTPAASVANLLVSFPATPAVQANHWLDATGILVPSASGRLLKAATFLSRKWPHLADDQQVIVRLSAGRAGNDVALTMDDDGLIRGMLHDFVELTGVDAEPLEALLVRWPQAMTQQTVGHAERVSRTREAIERKNLPVHLVGSSFDGVGLTSCFASAERTADLVAKSGASPLS